MNTKIATDAGSLKRGVALLKVLATAGSRGQALTELAEKTGIPHPSAHRVLKQLMAESLVIQHFETHRYKLGPLVFELGLAGSVLHDIRDLCEPSMQSLAKATEDTVYLVLRSGFEAVCMHRCEGSFPIRALILEVGSRRPLGVGAGGLAILSAMDTETRQTIIERVEPFLGKFGNLNSQSLAQACEHSTKEGRALVQNKVSMGVTAVGMAFRNSIGEPTGSISVAALTQRMTHSRLNKITELLKQEVFLVEKALRNSH
jgi:DNA-binding IclR family transcriptional regulator